MKVCLLTLGCKVSQYETESIARQFSDAGWKIDFDFCLADCYVINTCSVTSEAQKKSRQMVSKCRKLNPQAKILVCGCASQNLPKEFENEKTYVIGSKGKNKIFEHLQDTGMCVNSLECGYETAVMPLPAQTRAHLKIQEGCDNFCNYCLIPYIRGRSCSRDLKSIVAEAEVLAKSAKEIVLVGINISDYRINGELALTKLIEELKNVNARFRFGSLEVNVISREFMEAFKNAKNFAPHFHLSMQSGCTKTLKDMNRHYTKDEYLQKIELIRQYFPNACITTDVIVGYPTETESDFLETVETIKQAKFYNMHIFKYSRREGTVSYALPELPPETLKQRSLTLAKINMQNKEQYCELIKNTTQNVLLETENESYYVGHSEYYVKCYVPKSDKILQLNEIYEVKMQKIFQDGMIVALN